MTLLQRHNGRTSEEMRPLTLTYDVFSYAPGSVLLELGNTKVLCTVSMQAGVPNFLRGKGAGWLTAEYALLPNATHVRSSRESTLAQKNGRSVEIARLISRSLRNVVTLKGFGEQTIYVDCDVIQADGGTRTACITAASCALEAAQTKWLETGVLQRSILKERIAAVSVGILNNTVVLDPDYTEDSGIDADFNIVATESDNLIEMQGGAEKKSLSWDQFEQVRATAQKGLRTLFSTLESVVPLERISHVDKMHAHQKGHNSKNENKASFFSLQNRIITPQQ